MTSLQIRDLPDVLYEMLAEQAKRQNRSLAQQAIVVLAKGLEIELDRSERRKALVHEFRTKPLTKEKIADPVKVIREDRER